MGLPCLEDCQRPDGVGACLGGEGVGLVLHLPQHLGQHGPGVVAQPAGGGGMWGAEVSG